MPKTADLLEEIAALKAMLIAADARDKRKDDQHEALMLGLDRAHFSRALSLRASARRMASRVQPTSTSVPSR